MGQKPHLCFHLLCWSISYPIVLCGITVGFYYCKWEQNFLILSLKLSDYGPNCLFEWDKCMSLFKHIIKFLHNSFFAYLHWFYRIFSKDEFFLKVILKSEFPTFIIWWISSVMTVSLWFIFFLMVLNGHSWKLLLWKKNQ